MTPESDTSHFDVALSFSGDHRIYVAQVAAGLRARGYRVFYDEYLRAEILGEELLRYLQEVYSVRSKTVAAFVSAEWVTRPYTTHERETALAHALVTLGRGGPPFLLPFRFDDTPVPGLQATVAYEDLRQVRAGERRWSRDDRYRHPAFVTDLLVQVLDGRGIAPGLPAEVQVEDKGVRARVVWVDGQSGMSASGLVEEMDLEEGSTTIHEDERTTELDPPAGKYLLLPESIGVIVNPSEPIPVYLNQSHTAHEKTWVEPLRDLDQEVVVVDRVRRQVQRAVELEISTGAVSIGPTFTRTLPTPDGYVVVGACAIARPRRQPL